MGTARAQTAAAGGMGGGQAPSGTRGGTPPRATTSDTSSSHSELTALLETSTTTWSAAISGATSAADLELAGGTSVIAPGGWNGSDPSPTPTQIQACVAAGGIHYWIAGGQSSGGSGSGRTAAPQIATWVAAHYSATTGGSSTIYDLTATATCTPPRGTGRPHVPGRAGGGGVSWVCFRCFCSGARVVRGERHRALSSRTGCPQDGTRLREDHLPMRRRTLLGGLVAAAAGAGTGYATARQLPAAAGARSGPTGILSSTKTSQLAPRPVTAFRPAAGSAPAHRYAVGMRDFGFARGVDRSLPTRVWYPATGPAGAGVTTAAAPASGTFPLVVFSHGLSSQPNDYATMLTGWARAGFVVAAPIYPHTSYGTADFNTYDIVNQPADASSVITQMLALNESTDPLGSHLDPDRIGAAGHSAGGITTAGLFSAARDSRLTTGIVLAGTDFRSAPFAGAPAGMLFVHGRKDATIAYDAGHTVFEAVPWSRAMLSVTDGDHLIADGTVEAVNATTTEFLRWGLYGDRDARHRLAVKAAIGATCTWESELAPARSPV